MRSDRSNYSRTNVLEIKQRQTKQSGITPQVETAAANSGGSSACSLAPAILINFLALFRTSRITRSRVQLHDFELPALLRLGFLHQFPPTSDSHTCSMNSGGDPGKQEHLGSRTIAEGVPGDPQIPAQMSGTC